MPLILFACLILQATQAQWLPNGGSVIYYSGTVGINTGAPLGVFQVAGGTTYLQGLNLGYGAALGVVGTDASVKPISFQIGTTEYARLLANGSLGIGTTDTKGYLLAVNGSAIFTSARVKTYSNWPDFVFARDYRLPSLDSLSSFIQDHHHLPGIPSADSVQASGIDIGGTEAALLKKIEELTLYVIDQNKKLEAQQAEIRYLEQLIDRKK